MRPTLAVLVIALSALIAPPAVATQVMPAQTDAQQAEQPARIIARVSISRQVMEVFHEGRKIHEWPVSTARKGKVTPTGEWKGAQWLSRNHRSSLYNNAPMPYSIFFKGGYAVHGTNAVSKLGAPASHGCIRLATGNAAKLYSLVKQHGASKARIVIT